MSAEGLSGGASDDDAIDFDLDAVLAESPRGTPFRFRFGGELYELPADPDLRALAALNAERLDEGFRMLLGATQWERMRASDTSFGNEAFEKLLVRYQKHVGDLGESPASPLS